MEHLLVCCISAEGFTAFVLINRSFLALDENLSGKVQWAFLLYVLLLIESHKPCEICPYTYL